ncbi:MAG: NAD(P)-dependent alcohol dehydrogenase [Betaproteobacteria bacterium HGW-Betaproteobacteria-12]|nr:MAG: NAD(P)-dependent alcohol dehydrogenase [Betaproteobacteria bacterium HGW-Betaproteobacteria-12]
MTTQTSGSTVATAAVVRNVGGPFALEKIDVAAPREDEVLVRMVGVGVCHTDIVCRDGFPVPMPIVLGHEGSGIVEAVGTRVTNVKPGDRVVLSFNSCGHCPSCEKDLPATCSQFLPMNFAGIRLADGSSPLSKDGQPVHGMFFGQSSFATYAIARAVNTVRVPDAVPLEILGPLGCGIQTGAGAVINSLKATAGDSIAIFGGGAVGLSALLGARAVGVTKIFVVEPNPERRQLALELGASKVYDPRDGSDIEAAIKADSGGGVTYTIEATGIPAVAGQAINVTAPGGTVGLVGVPPPDGQIPATLLDLLVKGVTLRPITEGDANPQTFIPRMIELYQQGRFPFDRLVTKFPFDKINDAVHAAETGQAIKPVLVF